jgi:hypothetical protein
MPPNLLRHRRGLAETVLAAQILDRHAGLDLTQEGNDLLFGKTLLHVQSPSRGGLDSKLGRYSNPGGGALGQRGRGVISRFCIGALGYGFMKKSARPFSAAPAPSEAR